MEEVFASKEVLMEKGTDVKKRHDRKERNSSDIGEEMRETEIRAG